MDKKVSGKKSIFISSLPAGITSDQVRSFCETYGEILDIRVHLYVNNIYYFTFVRDPSSISSACMAVVDFSKAEDVLNPFTMFMINLCRLKKHYH
jgi:RNA recognition motif-containing protein